MYLTAVLFANSAPRGAACRRIELRGTIYQRIGDHKLINLADVAREYKDGIGAGRNEKNGTVEMT